MLTPVRCPEAPMGEHNVGNAVKRCPKDVGPSVVNLVWTCGPFVRAQVLSASCVNEIRGFVHTVV